LISSEERSSESNKSQKTHDVRTGFTSAQLTSKTNSSRVFLQAKKRSIFNLTTTRIRIIAIVHIVPTMRYTKLLVTTVAKKTCCLLKKKSNKKVGRKNFKIGDVPILYQAKASNFLQNKKAMLLITIFFFFFTKELSFAFFAGGSSLSISHFLQIQVTFCVQVKSQKVFRKRLPLAIK
jgi:uncharacterized membrane protein